MNMSTFHHTHILKYICLMALWAPVVAAQPTSAPVMENHNGPSIPNDIQVEEQVGTQLDLDAVFVNEDGQERPLRTFFDGEQPVILVPVFYNCASLCNLTLNQLITSLLDIPWLPGTGFQILTVTINPLEDAPLAKAKKTAYMEEFGRPGAERGWHFLTGSGDSIRSLMEAVGFGYRYDDDTMQYLHRAALIILTPDGEVHHYFHGAYTPPGELAIALVKAGDGHLGALKDRFWAAVHIFDAGSEKFVLNETLLLTVLAGMVLVLFFLAFLAIRHGKRVRPTD